jgi:hypothetical protein
MRRFVVCAILIVSSACGRPVQTGASTASPAAPSRDLGITSADQLLLAMNSRYTGKWYGGLTFVQKSTFYRPDGSSRVEVWYEALSLPGLLRIDLGEPSRGNGALYRNDSVYSIQNNRVVGKQRGRNPLLILGFDVYAQPPARTFAQLREEGFNLALLRTDTLYGKRTYVVGAGPGDLGSTQFWVEADRLLLVRLIQGGERPRDTRFENYVAHGGGWVAEEVRVLMNGQMVFREEYSNVRTNVALDAAFFIPEKWATAPHWFKQ